MSAVKHLLWLPKPTAGLFEPTCHPAVFEVLPENPRELVKALSTAQAEGHAFAEAASAENLRPVIEPQTMSLPSHA